MSKNLSYSDFFRQIKTCNELWKKNDFSGIVFAWGPSDFFLEKVINTFRTLHNQDEINSVNHYYSDNLSLDTFQSLCHQGGMFNPKEYHIISHLEKCKKFDQFIETIKNEKQISNSLLFTYLGQKLPAKLEQQISRLNIIQIPCFDPTKQELPKLIHDLSRKYQLNFAMETVSFMLESIGTDLFQLESEIIKLSYIYARQEMPLTPQIIAEHLGFLREDHVFQLTDFILKNHISHAHCLIDNLIDRGESGLAILGVLTKHLRNSLNIASYFKQGKTAESIAKEVRLPLFIVKSYNQYIQKNSIPKLIKALKYCQQLDLEFKSRRLDEKLALGELLSIITT